jgi:hypothetical protein
VGDILRVLGLGTSFYVVGMLVILAWAKAGTTGLAVPWRYWAVVAWIIFELTGAIGRIAAWTQPLTWRDWTFLAANVTLAVAITGLLSAPLGSAVISPAMAERIRLLEFQVTEMHQLQQFRELEDEED